MIVFQAQIERRLGLKMAVKVRTLLMCSANVLANVVWPGAC